MTTQLRSAMPVLLVAAGAVAAPQADAQTRAQVYDHIEDRLNELESQVAEAEEGGQSTWSPYVSEFGGRIMYDQTFNTDSDQALADFAGNDDGKLEDGAELRRVRFFAEGSVAPWLAYKLQLDFAGGVEAKDVYLLAHDLGNMPSIKIGHFKEPISLQEQTSSKYISLMSRTMLADNVISQGRSAGLMLSDHFANERVNLALGLFNPSFDGGEGETTSHSTDGESVVTGRLTSPLVYENDGQQVIHVGASFSQRNVDTYSLGLEPEVHKTDDFVATANANGNAGSIPVEDALVLGAELGAVLGPAHMQSEYGQVDLTTSRSGPDPSIDTYYIQGGFFLTGESRPYDPAAGDFGRVQPDSPFTGVDTGTGAWELVARYSSLDAEETAGATLRDADGPNTVAEEAVAETTVTTLGVNWYPVAHAKWMLNYVDADQDALGDASYVATRFQVDF